MSSHSTIAPAQAYPEMVERLQIADRREKTVDPMEFGEQMKRRAFQIGAMAVFTVGLFVVFQNCGMNGETTRPGGVLAKATLIQDLNRQIDDLNAGDLSCQRDSDCTTVEVGARACGGPERFLISSNLNPDMDQVLGLADEITKQTREYNRNHEVVSICSLAVAPEVACVQSQCQEK